MDANVMSPTDVWNLIVTNPFTSVVFILLVISEGLGSIAAIKSNSIYQLVVGLLKKLGPVK